MKIEIKDAAVVVESVPTKAGGKMELRSQWAWVDLDNGERVRVRIALGREGAPKPVGLYRLGDESFTRDGYQGLALTRELVLVPLVAAAQAKVG